MVNKRILVVDDDPDIVEYVCTFLEDHGYDAFSADASDSAITELEQESVDLIIVDVMMPGRSGLDLIATLRNDTRWSDLPVVLLTGNDGVLQDGGKSYQGLHAGKRVADGVLGKPLKLDDLLATLMRLGL